MNQEFFKSYKSAFLKRFLSVFLSRLLSVKHLFVKYQSCLTVFFDSIQNPIKVGVDPGVDPRHPLGTTKAGTKTDHTNEMMLIEGVVRLLE